MTYNFSELSQKTEEVQNWLKKEFSTIRTGRATPVILDSILVDSYGSKVHINQLASVNIEDPKSLRLSPWDMSQLKNIEKAITDANLGLSVSSDERGIRVTFPELTSERRQSLAKIVNQKHEEARVSLRKEREKIWEDIQEKEKRGELTEDDKFRLKNEMQKIVDEMNGKLDEMAERKEKEILT